MEGRKNLIIGILSLVAISIMLILTLNMAVGDPQGANLTRGASSRGSNPSPQTADAQAGNVTQLDINQTRITDVWQGYFGNVSGEISLENAAGNQFYEWDLGTVDGQIYASRTLVTDWTLTNCTNQTQIYNEEYTLNIDNETSDGINDTFTSTSHPSFYIGSNIITSCRSTRPYNSSSQPGDFWNVLVNSDATNVVYTSVLADNSNAFDNSTVDFELLVPVDRDTGIATYYFYAELS